MENLLAPDHEPHNKHWFVCVECGGISRFILVAGVMALYVPTVDEFADVEDGGQRTWIIAMRRLALRAKAKRETE